MYGSKKRYTFYTNNKHYHLKDIMHISLRIFMTCFLSFHAALLTCDKEKSKIIRKEERSPQGTLVTYTLPDGTPISSYVIGMSIYNSGNAHNIYTICQLQAQLETQKEQK